MKFFDYLLDLIADNPIGFIVSLTLVCAFIIVVSITITQ